MILTPLKAKLIALFALVSVALGGLLVIQFVSSQKSQAAYGKSAAVITGVSEEAVVSKIPITRESALIGEIKLEPTMAVTAKNTTQKTPCPFGRMR